MRIGIELTEERLHGALPRSIERHKDATTAQATRLEAVAQRLLVPYDASLARAAASLEALSPLKVLARGYAIARDEEGHVVSDASALQVGDQLSVLLGKGTAHTQVMSVESAS